MVGKIVVIFDWFKGGGLAEESKMMDWGWGGEECLESFDHRKAGTENGD